MARSTDEVAEQRYIGDADSKFVHDSYHEDPTPRGCRIFELVKSRQALRFDPDRLAQALSEGFTMCEKCMERIDDRPSRLWKQMSEETNRHLENEEGS